MWGRAVYVAVCVGRAVGGGGVAVCECVCTCVSLF